VGECTRRRRMESLVLFFFFLFYCVPTTLLVPPHLSLDISWQGEWLAQKEEVEKRTDLSLFFFFLDFPFIIYLRMRPQKLLPLTFFFYSPDEKIGLKWHWSDFFFFFPIWKQWRNFNKIILFLLHQKNTCVLISLMFGSMFFQCV
jgi:hypothetical protein